MRHQTTERPIKNRRVPGVASIAGLDDAVRQILCRHLAALSDSPDQKTMLSLFSEVYAVVTTTSRRQRQVADTYDAAVWDAGYRLPVSALHLLEAAAKRLARMDKRALVFPHRTRSYIFSACPLLIYRLMKNAGDCEEELPSLPEPNMWFGDLLKFDYTVAKLATGFLAEWTPPGQKGRKTKRVGKVVNDSVIEQRQKLRDIRARLREAEATSKRFKRTRGPLPWSDASFCAEHALNLREFYKWLGGLLPDVSVTSQSIERALKTDIRRMREAGVKSLIPASPVTMP